MTGMTGGSETFAAAQTLRELLESLARWQELLRQLEELADHKLSALRAADASALQSCARREAALLPALARAGREREALLARLAQGLRDASLSKARLGRIAERFPEPARSSIRARSMALREIASRLDRKNRIAAAVARKLQGHVRAVLAELTGTSHEPVAYGRGGEVQTPAGAAARVWVDAVG